MTNQATGPLGGFLRAQRARIEPAEAGLFGGGSRRVAGLRREEVAVLAGVSADYYARLEQGRESNPSAQVLNAISGALKLDADARGHLYRLAGLNPNLAPAQQPGSGPSLPAAAARLLPGRRRVRTQSGLRHSGHQ
ncbi:helix-turn-helix domain-containing protein [Streptacidiphilus sp. PAMC 29251]